VTAGAGNHFRATASELDGGADNETVFFVSHRHAFAGRAARDENANAVCNLIYDQVAQTWLINRAAGREGCNESRRAAAQPVELCCHSKPPGLIVLLLKILSILSKTGDN